MNTLRMLRKSGRARALNPNHRPEGSWALETRMLENLVPITHEQNIICSKTPLDGTTHEQTII